MHVHAVSYDSRGEIILQEKETETLSRMLMTPAQKYAILLGKWLGTYLFAIIQFFIFLIVTINVFGVDWGGNLLFVSVLGLAYAAAVSGISMLLASCISDMKSADAIGGFGIQLLAVLGGSMLPLYQFPDFLQSVSKAVPNRWALDGFLSLMEGEAGLTFKRLCFFCGDRPLFTGARYQTASYKIRRYTKVKKS